MFLLQVKRVNRNTIAMLKKMLLDKEDKNWPDCISTMAWNHRSNVHKSTNFKPIHLLTGRQPKLLPGGQQFDLDITKNPDLTQQEIEKILDETSTQNLSNYESIHEHFEANVGINIKKSVLPK